MLLYKCWCDPAHSWPSQKWKMEKRQWRHCLVQDQGPQDFALSYLRLFTCPHLALCLHSTFGLNSPYNTLFFCCCELVQLGNYFTNSLCCSKPQNQWGRLFKANYTDCNYLRGQNISPLNKVIGVTVFHLTSSVTAGFSLTDEDGCLHDSLTGRRDCLCCCLMGTMPSVKVLCSSHIRSISFCSPIVLTSFPVLQRKRQYYICFKFSKL